MTALEVTKTLTGFSCAHRLHTADTHCRYIHGYDRTFVLTVGAVELDANGWVYDFGGFKTIRDMLEVQFDHTLCVSADDPLLHALQDVDVMGGCDLRVMDHPGIEGAVQWCVDELDPYLEATTDGRCFLAAVSVAENAKNRIDWRRP